MYPGATMCRLLGVSTSGYYAWHGRAPSARADSDTALLERIGEIHRTSRETDGAPRIHAELAAKGIAVGRRTSSTIPIRDRSTPRSPSERGAARPRCGRPWARSAMPTTMPFASPFLLPRNASCSTAADSHRTPRRAPQSSNSSKVGTIRAAGTRPSAISHRSISKGTNYPLLAKVRNRPRNRGKSNLAR